MCVFLNTVDFIQEITLDVQLSLVESIISDMASELISKVSSYNSPKEDKRPIVTTKKGEAGGAEPAVSQTQRVAKVSSSHTKEKREVEDQHGVKEQREVQDQREVQGQREVQDQREVSGQRDLQGQREVEDQQEGDERDESIDSISDSPMWGVAQINQSWLNIFFVL